MNDILKLFKKILSCLSPSGSKELIHEKTKHATWSIDILETFRTFARRKESLVEYLYENKVFTARFFITSILRA